MRPWESLRPQGTRARSTRRTGGRAGARPDRSMRLSTARRRSDGVPRLGHPLDQARATRASRSPGSRVVARWTPSQDPRAPVAAIWKIQITLSTPLTAYSCRDSRRFGARPRTAFPFSPHGRRRISRWAAYTRAAHHGPAFRQESGGGQCRLSGGRRSGGLGLAAAARQRVGDQLRRALGPHGAGDGLDGQARGVAGGGVGATLQQ